jgi:hypothetical protein
MSAFGNAGVRFLLLVTLSAAVLGGPAVPSAAAHKSNWCKHSDRTSGAQWWIFYGGHYWVDAGENAYYHYHTTHHYYGPNRTALHKYKHTAKKICTVAGGVPARVLGADEIPLAVWCPQPEVRTSRGENKQCESPPAEDEIPVEEAPGASEDPNDWAPSAPTSMSVSRELHGRGIGARWTTVGPAIDGQLVAREVSESLAGACVTAITTRSGAPFDFSAPGEAQGAPEIETASPAIARSLGHPCL